MKTLIVEHGGFVRFLMTNHPKYRFSMLEEQMPVGVKLVLMGVTDIKAKQIKIRFASKQHLNSVWYKLDEEFEKYLSRIVS